ncbi:hypothetical protein, partial [Clostridium beijerinckii]|uniref:hypothetical protein n=1 Tax=Clostridium beijerinckii TaxID=1520 RepID=UPI002431621B
SIVKIYANFNNGGLHFLSVNFFTLTLILKGCSKNDVLMQKIKIKSRCCRTIKSRTIKHLNLIIQQFRKINGEVGLKRICRYVEV